MLMLLGLERISAENGERERLAQSVLAVLHASIRETDIVGWYQADSILGGIFNGIGTSTEAANIVRLIATKVMNALNQHLGTERTARISLSCHIFPEVWDSKGDGCGAQNELYPDVIRDSPRWLRSAGKRLLDIAGSVAALICLSPLFGLIALAIKLTSKGPVLFRQERIGQKGSRFVFLKFRSMYDASDPQVHRDYVTRFISGAPESSRNGVYKLTDDPRITPLGRILRKTSLDELPQFWNVLRGEMSLVGPRPPVPYEVEAYSIWHRRRLLEAKPGITGLWQVSGRSRLPFDDMVRLDLQYTRSSSLWLDVRILLQTPRAVLFGAGAY
jgi:lipopolysaccharide/colanic/teichoic acid biosynthesis glycosyltransferase